MIHSPSFYGFIWTNSLPILLLVLVSPSYNSIQAKELIHTVILKNEEAMKKYYSDQKMIELQKQFGGR